MIWLVRMDVGYIYSRYECLKIEWYNSYQQLIITQQTKIIRSTKIFLHITPKVLVHIQELL